MKRSIYPPSLTFGQIVEETTMDMSGADEMTIMADEMTIELLQKSLAKAVDSAVLRENNVTLTPKSPVKMFMGDPNIGIELDFKGVAGHFMKDKPHELVIIVEPTMLSNLIKEPDLSKFDLSKFDPPTPRCDCSNCIEKRKFIDKCNTAEAQQAKDSGGLN